MTTARRPAAADVPRAASAAAVGAAVTAAAGGLFVDRANKRSVMVRRNFRDRPVLLTGGPALVAGLAAAAVPRPRLAALVCGVGALGAYDDLRGQTHARGLRGHLHALSSGTVTTGAVKVVGLTALAFALAPTSDEGSLRRVEAAALIAGGANLLNLLDLRPGRALKVAGLAALGLAGASPHSCATVLGPVVAAAPDDLAEHAMLGDCGANAVGAALGWLAVAALGRRGRRAVLAAIVGLTLASERVSFSRVIEDTPWLAALDGLGRAD